MTDRIQKIYTHGINILEQVGIKLRHPEILELIKRNGARVDGDIAFFTRKIIEEWISKAPESFTLHARNPVYDSFIGGDHSHFISSYGCPTIYESDGTARASKLADYIRFAKLIHQCDHFSINGGIIAQPSDVPAGLSHLIMLYTAIKTSDKCLMGIPCSEFQMNQIMEMAALLFGGRDALIKTPRIITLINTISPLLMDEMALAAILVSARYNQPLIISPGPAAGTTGPVDLAGNMALATAEALAGIVIAQMVRPGVPVIFGLQCSGADLKTANISIGSPAAALQTKYTAALARMLKLPSRSGGTNTDALCVSPQSGYEGMLSMLTACQNAISLIIHSTGVLDSFAAISYEKFIIDIEIMDMVKYYLTDFEISDATLDMDLIRQAGHGGQFLTSMDTLKKCRTHSWMPQIGVRGNIGPPDALERYFRNIKNRLHQMLISYRKPEFNSEIRKTLDDFMIRQGVTPQILSLTDELIIRNTEGN